MTVELSSPNRIISLNYYNFSPCVESINMDSL